MKKLQKLRLVTNGAGFFGGYMKSASVLLCGIVLSFAFWTATSVADERDKDKDRVGASEKDKDSEKAKDSEKDKDKDKDKDHDKDCTVCDNDKGKSHEIKMECHDVEKFLREHPEDCRGDCPCQPTPVKNP